MSVVLNLAISHEFRRRIAGAVIQWSHFVRINLCKSIDAGLKLQMPPGNSTDDDQGGSDMLRVLQATVLIGTLALTACAVPPPTGPSVMAMPARGKTFEEFQQDDAACRAYASQQIGNGSPAQAANESATNSAIVGTLVGAALGAAIGAAAGNPALGAAAGAGGGLLVGGGTGLSAAQDSAAALQYRYDVGYIQCMSAKGESVPTNLAGAQSYPYYYPYRYYYPWFPIYYPGY